nr:hypothetical protein [Tanacetum cinerariifolium]
MNKLVRHNQVRGLPAKCFENDHTCTTCLKGKQHKASCKSKLVNSVSKPLHTLHMDLFGPTSVSSISHKWYCLVVTDDFSRCDNGREFRNKEMNDFCSLKGIKREFSNARTPQQNGVAERRNRTLIEAVRTMVLVNKSQNKTPYELFNGRTPAIGFLKPFGCHVMILNTLDNLGKFEAKGDEGYFIGYSMSSKAFRVFNNRTKRVEENLHVEFLENKAIEKGVGQNWLFDIDSLTKSMNYVPVDASTNSTNLSGTKDASSQQVKKDVSSLRYIALPNWVHDALLKSSSSKPQDDCSTNVPKSSRNSNPTATLTNPPGDQLETLIVETPIPTVSSPIITACLNDSPEPSNILRVTTNSVDSDGVEADNVWTLVNCPKEVRPIETKWFLKNKKDERGIVIRNKARLVAQGHTQEKWIDYDEVFAPVARIEANRLFLAYASFMGFTIYQMDVKSAFLYGTIDEEVYVMQPPGFQDLEFQAKMYNVEKAMYGLHQAPRAWYGTMSKYLLTNGFQRGTIDQTLFIIRQRGDFILVQVYVDDIIFGSSNPQLCREFEALMHEKFQMSAMGELNFFLGLQVLQKEDGIFLSQDKQLWPLQQLRQNMLQLPVDVDKFCGFRISCLIMEFSSSQPQDNCSTEVPEGSGNSNPTASTSNPPTDQMETLTVETLIPTVSLPVPTAYSTDSQEPSSDARLISKRVANQAETSSLDNILSLTNWFEDILGAITDSPTPTLRIHKDHPKSQIIGPMDTPIQTRNKSKETLVDCPKGVRPIGTKWVIKNKKDERGVVIRNKARLVAQGHTQEEGIDYDEVFAPVARIEAIRLFLAYASFMDFVVYQMDVKSAFLYGTINEEAPRAWYGTLLKYLLKNGFQRGTIDQTLFIRKQREDFILVQVYVDDIIFGSSNPQLCREFQALMHEKFQMSAMGELNFFLGLQVLQKEDGIFLLQDKYVGDILKKFGYTDVKNKQEKDKIGTKPDQIKKKGEAWKSPEVSKTNHSQNIRKITPSEPIDSLNMGDEHLDIIPATESDEFIKSCVENLVPNPNESEGENECDVPAGFTTFSNVLFDADYDFDSVDDQSTSDEDFLKNSMLNHDSSSKTDSLFDEFASELTLLKSIPPEIDETDCHHEKETRFVKRLLYDNLSPQLLNNYSLSLPANESYHFDIPSPYHPPAKPPD